MADISKLRLPGSETTYDIKDAVAREAISHINSFDYVIAKDAGTTPYGVKWGDPEVTGTLVASADTLSKIYLVPSTNGTHDVFDEYITVNTNTSGTGDPTYAWEMFGNTDVHLDDLGALAFADTASTTYTPEGSISVGSGTANYTPAGSISVGNGATNYTPAGTIGTGSGTANYTPEGSVAVTATDTSVYVVAAPGQGEDPAVGSVTNGTAASCTLPTWSATTGESGTADAETLIFSWSAGSFTANTPTAVTLPTFSSQTVVDSVDAAASFTGTGVELTFSGTGTDLEFGGTAVDLEFAGTQATVQVSPDPVTP